MNRIVLHRLGRHSSDHDLEPSCGVMDICQGSHVRYRIVVDAGSVIRRKNGREWLAGPDLSLLADGKLIDAILVTHAHDDHAGFVPALIPYLKDGAPIWMTRPTMMCFRYNLQFDLMPDNGLGPEKPYGEREARAAMQSVAIMDHVGRYRAVPGIDVWAHPAGHIAGACSFTFDINGVKVHYSGDRCRHDQPSVLGAPPLPDNWQPDIVAGSDCTYGQPVKKENVWAEEMDRYLEFCEQVYRQKRRMLVYTFAKHRAGAIAHEMQAQRVIRSQQRCYMDGTARDYARMMNGKHGWCNQDSAFNVDKVGMLEGKYARHAVNDSRLGSYIVIAPPGMGGPGGSGTWWRRRLLSDPTAVIAFTGYAAPGTDGYHILEQARKRDSGQRIRRIWFQERNQRGAWRTKEYPFHCQVEHFRLGSHGNRTETVQWFRDLSPRIAVLSHGSRPALASVEKELDGSGISTVRTDENPSLTIDL